jgi:ankyrin repeat protein
MHATSEPARPRLYLRLAVALLAMSAMLAEAGSVASQEFLSALERGDTDAAARLLGAGVDVDAQRSDGKTLLILAAKEGDVVLVRRLITAGADVNATTGNGGTALMFAAIGGDLDTQTALIEAGADVNAIGGFHWTALMVASVKGHALVARQLLASGADPNLTDVYGWTPLMRAVYEERYEVVQALLQHPEVNLDARNDQGATALHLAAGKGNEDLAQALLLAGASPLVEDRGGRTPALTALRAGHERLAELLGYRSSQ